MLKNFRPSQLWPQVVATFRRFPLATSSALLGTVIAWIMIESHNELDWMGKILMTSVFSTFFFAAYTLFCESLSSKNRAGMMALGIILILSYYLHLPVDFEMAGEATWKNLIFLCLGSLMALTWAPFWRTNTKETNLWEWNRQLLMNLITTMVLGIIIFLGLVLALFSIQSLFGFDIDGEWYFRIWIGIVGLFGPFFFLHEIPETPTKVKMAQNPPKLMKVLTKFILVPLSTGYFVILYAYTTKILILQDWPANILGWLVVCFSFIAIVTYFLLTPFITSKWPKYQRMFWWILFPQIVLLFIAISWRIGQYGWTDNRYFVSMLGVFLAITALYHSFRSPPQFKYILGGLTGIIFLTQMPFIGGYAIGKKSQLNRLEELLTEHQILQEGRIVPTHQELSQETRYQISDLVSYMLNHYGSKSLTPLLGETVTDLSSNRYTGAREIVETFGFEYTYQSSSDPTNEYQNFHTQWDQPRNIEGFDWSVPVSFYEARTFQIKDQSFKVEYNRSKSQIEISKNQIVIHSVDLNAFLQSILDQNLEANQDLDPEILTYQADEFQIIFQHLNTYQGAINGFDATLYLQNVQ